MLMHFHDILKLCNRMGIRPVNDVTAQVTADVTAAMDPDGMGAHMGPPVAALPLAEDGLDTQILSEVVTKREFMLAVKELGGVFMQGHATTLAQVVTLNTEIMGHVVTLNTQMKGYVDQELEAKGRVFETKYKEMEAKFEQRLASVLNVQGNPRKKRAKKLSKYICKNIFFAHGSYNWRKTIKRKLGYKGSYKTLGEAQQGLAHFCQENTQA